MGFELGANKVRSESGSSLPLHVLPEQADPFGPQQVSRWVWGFIALGIIARVVRYAVGFPLWIDECFVASNLLDRGYLGLTETLDYHQVCPLLFLWVQLTVVKLLGLSEYSLRLFPLVCGLAGLLLFRHLAGRLLKGTALLLAVATFAVAYPAVRYTAEAKQYGSEMFVSLVLLSLTIEWWRCGRHDRWLWGLAMLAPIAVGLSYTAVFVGGGISFFVAFVLWKSHCRRGWIPWLAYSLALAGSFVAVFLTCVKHQSAGALEFMQAYWQNSFPPIAEPVKLVGWLIVTHTSDLLAYPFGGERGASTLTFICCATGTVMLYRRRQFGLLLLCLAPLPLSFLAAALHRYPYGVMTKFQFFMAPIFCVLAGLGAAALLLWQAGRRPARPTPVLIALTVLLSVGMGSIARDFWYPAKSKSDARARDFARWFWFSMAHDGEVVCLKTDLGRSFSPGTFDYGFSAMYLCNQRIYSPRHAQGRPPRLDRVSADWPLRCVEYHASRYERDEEALAQWLEEMQARYQLVGRDRYPFAYYNKRETRLGSVDFVEVYKFIPKVARGKEQLSGIREPHRRRSRRSAHCAL